MPTVLRFIEPCLPSPADRPPSGSNWIYEIKHDGYRLMARRDPVGIRLITRRGNDWTIRFPLVVEAVNHLKVRSCLIDGEVVCCDERARVRSLGTSSIRRRCLRAMSATLTKQFESFAECCLEVARSAETTEGRARFIQMAHEYRLATLLIS